MLCALSEAMMRSPGCMGKETRGTGSQNGATCVACVCKMEYTSLLHGCEKGVAAHMLEALSCSTDHTQS